MVAWREAKGGKISIKMVAWWKARGGSLKNDLDFRWSQDLHFKQSIVEAQVSTGGGSETGPRHK